jgi:broad specificity phosphatase PhoE
LTELFLVRHGQADSTGDNYDQLTEAGHDQARRVGAWLLQNGYQFDRVLHGGLKRQQQTLEAIGGAFAAAGVVLPAMEIHSGFAEFDLKVWGVIAGRLRHGHPEFSELLKQWNRARHENSPNKGEIFKQLTGLILKEWVGQGESFTDAESFPAFKRRVLSAMEIQSSLATGTDQQAEPLENSSYLAVTSGGPISLITGEVLGLDLGRTLGLMRRVYNTSIHHFVRTEAQWNLVAFNTVPHLPVSERTLV